MNDLHLKGRLSLCAGFVRAGSRLADIGTDHGYLPIALCESGRISSAIACDINPLPLASARENIERRGLSDKISLRLGDGLEKVSADEVDDIVIAGMGGELIWAIIDACPWSRDGSKRFILQPMTRHDRLIRKLYENGFDIVSQSAVSDSGKYYTVIAAVYDSIPRECDHATAAVGKLAPDSEAARGFLKKCLDQLNKQRIGDPSLLPAAERIRELLNEDI